MRSNRPPSLQLPPYRSKKFVPGLPTSPEEEPTGKVSRPLEGVSFFDWTSSDDDDEIEKSCDMPQNKGKETSPKTQGDNKVDVLHSAGNAFAEHESMSDCIQWLVHNPYAFAKKQDMRYLVLILFLNRCVRRNEQINIKQQYFEPLGMTSESLMQFKLYIEQMSLNDKKILGDIDWDGLSRILHMQDGPHNWI